MITESIQEFCHQHWHDSALPELIDYIRIPNKSPMFDPEWQANGYMEEAVSQFERWCRAQEIPGIQMAFALP